MPPSRPHHPPLDPPLDPYPEPVVLERAHGPGGELVLRAAPGGHHEIISNGTFLMDTRNGESERLLVRAAAEGARAPARMLIGGLGVGFSLAQALRLPAITRVTVVEREPAVIAWHRPGGPLAPWSGGALADPRVHVHQGDLLDWLASAPPGAHDVACLDIDNGPDWTVTPGNARLYGPGGLELLRRALGPRGVLAVWSAAASPAFEALLRERFARVTLRPVPVPRGEPDVVYLAHSDAAGLAAP
jgi:spermidine synthase